jgi:hypothetical protein
MNKYQVAIGIVAASELDKPQDVTSKRRAGTKRASFKISRDGIEDAIVNTIHRDRQPVKPPVQTVGVYGLNQGGGIRVWRS